MSLDACPLCRDKGVVRVNWADAPDDYAVCLCAVGLRLRVDRNAGHTVTPLWRVWCAREQVDPERVVMLEDVLTPDELTAAGLGPPGQTADAREAALLRAGKTHKAKL